VSKTRFSNFLISISGLVRLALVGVVTLPSNLVHAAVDRTLLAEGDYVELAKSGSKPQSHWRLWQLDSGEYEVVDESLRNASSVQIFRFDSNLMPLGFTKKAGPVDSSDHRFPGIPGYEISCDYKPNRLTCTSSGNSNQSISAQPPYVALGEFYDLDTAWFMTGVVHLAFAKKTEAGLVNVYSISGASGPLGISLKTDRPIKVTFQGDDTAYVLDRIQPVKKYRWTSRNIPILIGTPQGLIVRLTTESDSEAGFAINNYKEYKPWGIPFGSRNRDTKVTSSQVSTAPSAQAPVRRIVISSGIMVGLLVHRVQPTYPKSAKQDKVQGKVVLHAVISTDGKPTELTPVSGPKELIKAAMDAVKQWEYKPYISQGKPAEVDTHIVVSFVLSE
jgi:TonB family protein